MMFAHTQSVPAYIMWKAVLCIVGCCTVVCRSDDFGDGKWDLRNMEQCPNPQQYKIDFVAHLRKVNRTHAAFTARTDLAEELDKNTYGCYIEVNKKVDGGWRMQYQFNEASFCNFLKQNVGENFAQILTKAGYDNPDCPVSKGEFEIENYMFDVDELPRNFILGQYEIYGYLVKASQRVACLKLLADFNEIET